MRYNRIAMVEREERLRELRKRAMGRMKKAAKNENQTISRVDRQKMVA